jgi:septal ring factor EnvC (AmiA/AmiB activator)
MAKLKSVGGDLARLMSSAKANQAEVERVADSLNRINLDLAKLEKRVAGNEEWVASVNAFRRQVNTSLGELQATIRALQASPG